jgi:hypothetical protein
VAPCQPDADAAGAVVLGARHVGRPCERFAALLVQHRTGVTRPHHPPPGDQRIDVEAVAGHRRRGLRRPPARHRLVEPAAAGRRIRRRPAGRCRRPAA